MCRFRHKVSFVASATAAITALAGFLAFIGLFGVILPRPLADLPAALPTMSRARTSVAESIFKLAVDFIRFPLRVFETIVENVQGPLRKPLSRFHALKVFFAGPLKVF